MKRIKLIIFGQFRNFISQDVIEVDLEGPINVRNLLLKVSKNFPIFKEISSLKNDEELRSRIIIMKNDGVVKLEDMLDDGDCLSILPPMAGG